jgi:hypothetical protein
MFAEAIASEKLFEFDPTDTGRLIKVRGSHAHNRCAHVVHVAAIHIVFQMLSASWWIVM